MNINQEGLKVVGKAGLKIGKAIIIEGTKAVIANSVSSMVLEGLDSGISGIKNMKLDDHLGNRKGELVKKLFKRKKKELVAEVVADIVEEVATSKEA